MNDGNKKHFTIMSYDPNGEFHCYKCGERIGPVTQKASLWCSSCNVWQHLCRDVKVPVPLRTNDCPVPHPWYDPGVHGRMVDARWGCHVTGCDCGYPLHARYSRKNNNVTWDIQR